MGAFEQGFVSLRHANDGNDAAHFHERVNLAKGFFFARAGSDVFDTHCRCHGLGDLP